MSISCADSRHSVPWLMQSHDETSLFSFVKPPRNADDEAEPLPVAATECKPLVDLS